jgi:hypothetical protein
MATTTQPVSTTSGSAAPRARAALGEARSDLNVTVDAVRSAVDGIGRRVPELLDGARTGASEGARRIESWPEPTRRLVAAFSIGLGAGLTIAGAPRLLVVVALLPAAAVAASAIGHELPG